MGLLFSDADLEGIVEHEGLSGRMAEVLPFLLRGTTTQEISCSLGVAYSTARTYVERIFGRFDAHSRMDLIARALEIVEELKLKRRAEKVPLRVLRRVR